MGSWHQQVADKYHVPQDTAAQGGHKIALVARCSRKAELEFNHGETSDRASNEIAFS